MFGSRLSTVSSQQALKRQFLVSHFSMTASMTAKRTDSAALEGMETARSTSPVPSAPPANGTRPKVTAWRLLNTTLLVGFGIYKSHHSTLGVSTSDWIICIGWAVVAYWGTYMESEAPTVAPWLFVRDILLPTWLVVVEAITIAWFIWGVRLPYVWAFPANEADRTVPTYFWIACVANALFTPFQFWLRVSESIIITWGRTRWMQFRLDERSDLTTTFMLGKLIAGLAIGTLVAPQPAYDVYHFTRGSDPAPSVTYAWLITASISLFVPTAICGMYLVVRRQS
ncbi:hypothetical protein MSAN_00878500 [Mycena sanguinolenta]|uniref:Uncharacterized protein n=1 Tax=Mycena sanguinolenta TaxID=230812 RepID=A0A8H6Z009_9AGAR|nr:hypothetical protein MSAN_00878500 [Mycena sanguinolenta]